MGRREDLIGAAKTRQAPTVQEANPVRPPVKSPNAASLDNFMSSEQFLNRNPGARDLDAERAARQRKKLEDAQANQGQRPNSGPGNRNGRPNVRQTERSLRDDPRRPLTPPQAAIMSNDILREALKKLLPQ